jgi:methylphosphotriester-DNA--protein-cysteine methyltransferase
MHQQEIISLIRSGRIKLAGYKKARIYGTLHCRSGKRMKTENRVFFSSEEEALNSGYRPCGHCLPEKYKLWKAKTGQNNLLS